MGGPAGVPTTSGTVLGRVDGGVREALGIPFGRARRFDAPEPVHAPAHVAEAQRFGAVCPQPPGDRFMGVDGRQDEDCLSLNVWAPEGAGRRPVMVWVHGGGFRTGGGSHLLCHGARLARRGDVVVVTVNYRLGALGFLAHPDLARSSGGPWANWGVLDVLEALRWVHANAEAFGGDPGNVTLFGESAGGVLVSLLLGEPAARGLFHRAAVQSGAPSTATPDRAAGLAGELAAEVGADSVGGLADVPAGVLLDAQQTLERRHRTLMLFTPVLDGVVLTRPTLEALAAGEGAGVPTIVGTNVDEVRLLLAGAGGRLDLDDDRLVRRVGRVLGDGGGEVIATYRRERSARGEPTTPVDLWAAIESDRFFRVPALELADALAAGGTPTFVYDFAWRSPGHDGWLGACHVLEIPFVFGLQGEADLAWFTGSGAAADALAGVMQHAWAAFARAGDPSTGGLAWPRYDQGGRATMVLDWPPRVERAPRELERSVVARWSRASHTT